MMQFQYISEEIKYDGTQLRSHFAYRNFGLLGDSCLAFLGPCEVTLDRMVDLEDVKNQAPIYSPKMLHFILETFSQDLKATAWMQRMMISLVAEQLHALGASAILRRGDDLYLQDKKLSVSIAAPSPVSCLIHLGLNVETRGTPVSTCGLADLGVDPETFAKNCLEAFGKEISEVDRATYKVRGVR